MNVCNKTSSLQLLWHAVAIVLIVAAGWVAFEWLFFVTKISFMSLFSPMEKVNTLTSTTLVVAIGLLLASLPFFILGLLADKLLKKPLLTTVLMLFPVTLLLSQILLVMIDNFSLTVFGWGIRSASGIYIWCYRMLTIALLGLAFRWMFRGLTAKFSPGSVRVLIVFAGLLSVISIPLMLMVGVGSEHSDYEFQASMGDRPNIIILSGDGVAADHMSLYGYHRKTTPFMDSARNEFLIAENHFSNAKDTGGSVISLLTGKLPTTTKVVYPPDTLRGQDSLEHLPAILRKLAYYNADVSLRHYADPYDLNLRNGFAEANFRQLENSGGTVVTFIRNYPLLVHASMLLDRISERISERFGHVWKGKPMSDPVAEVNRPDRRWIRDPARMNELRRLVQDAPRPFFVHVHMMGTHGERFRPTQRFFSTEDDYENVWSVDGYDDAILDFDRNVQETYQLLNDAGILDSTILVVSSDHGFAHSALDRLPMLMRLPGKARTGTIPGNTQRLDIAPTLLHSLGLPKPEWMEGGSMLRPDFSGFDQRPIFASGSREEKSADGNFWSVSRIEPPWYSLGSFHLVYCDQGFQLDIDTLELKEQAISGSSVVCKRKLDLDEARRLMYRHLEERGYSWRQATSLDISN